MSKNVTFTLTPDKADALCTLLSALENGSPLEGLYHAMYRQFSRGYKYKLVDSEQTHPFYNTPRIKLVSKREEV